MPGTTLKEFFAKLGLDLDKASFTAGEKALGALKSSLMGLAAGALAGLGIQKLVSDTANLGDSVDEASQATGVATDALQELTYAAKFSGLGLDDMKQSLGFLARNMTAAQKGGSEQAAAFERLGVATTDANGKLRGADAVMTDLADGFAALPDGVEKASLATQIFGRDGMRMIPFLNGGSEAMAAQRAEAERLGYVLDHDAVAAAAGFNDSMDHAKSALVGVRNAIVGPMLSSLKDAANVFTEWVAVNRKFIALRVGQVFRVIGGVLKAIWIVLSPIVKIFGALASNTKVLTGAAIALGIALLALAGEYAVAGAAAVASATWAAAAWLLAAAPVAILVALLVVIAAIAEDIMGFLRGDRSLIGDFIDSWDGFLKSWTYNVDEGDGWLTKALHTVIALLGDFANMWSAIVDQIDEDLRSITAGVLDALDIDNTGSTLNAEVAAAKKNTKATRAATITAQRSHAARVAAARQLGVPVSNLNPDVVGQGVAESLALYGGQPEVEGPGGTGAISYAMTAPITIHAAPGQSPDDIGAAVQVHLEGIFRQAKESL